MRPLRSALALLLTLALPLSGCGAPAGDSDRITLTLGDQVRGLQTLLDAAGVLEDTPYDVKWAQFQGAAPLFEAVKSGSVDTATAADLPTLQAASGGVPITAVAATRNTGESVTLLTQPDSAIRSVADLAGQEVVVSSARGSIAEYLLVRALEEVGLSIADVTISYLLPTDAQAAFSSGQIEVWATFGVYGITALAGGAHELVNGTEGRTSGIGVISASDAALAEPDKRAAITDLLQRIARAYEWSRDNPEEYAEIFAETNRLEPDIAATLVEQGTTHLEPMSTQVQDAVQEVSDTMTAVGSLPEAVDVPTITDDSLFTEPVAEPSAG